MITKHKQLESKTSTPTVMRLDDRLLHGAQLAVSVWRDLKIQAVGFVITQVVVVLSGCKKVTDDKTARIGSVGTSKALLTARVATCLQWRARCHPQQ